MANLARTKMMYRILRCDDGNTRLPFGLCKEFGIKLPDYAGPWDAWRALKDTGISEKEAYEALGEDGDIAAYVEKIKKDWTVEKSRDVKYANQSRMGAKSAVKAVNKAKAAFREIETKGLGEIGDVNVFEDYDVSISHMEYRISKAEDDEEREYYQNTLKELSHLKEFKTGSRFLTGYKRISDEFAEIKKLEKEGAGAETLRAHSEKISGLIKDEGFKESLDELKGYSPELYGKVTKELKKVGHREKFYAFQDRFGRAAFMACDVGTLSFNEKAMDKAINHFTNSEYGKAHPKLAEAIATDAETYVRNMKSVTDKIRAVSEKAMPEEDKEKEYGKLRERIGNLAKNKKFGKGKTQIYKEMMSKGLYEAAKLCEPDWKVRVKKNKLKYSDISKGKYDNPKATKRNCVEGMRKKFKASDMTEERIKNATVCFDQYMSRGIFGNAAKKVLENATDVQKAAIITYTGPSDMFNAPLSGYGKSDELCTWEKANFRGIGNVGLDEFGAKEQINALTEIINKSELDRDVMLERGVGPGRVKALFGTDDLSYGALEEIINRGEIVHQPSFCSCGASEGTAFPGEFMFDIYCPKGTKGLYVSSLSAFGVSDEKMNEAVRDSHYFEDIAFEDEVVLQRDTYFKPIGIRRDESGKIHITLGVVEQAPLDYKKIFGEEE